MLPRSRLLRALVLSGVLGVSTLAPTAPAHAQRVASDHVAAAKAPAAKDPRRTRGLFVDPRMPAYQQGGRYRTKIGAKAQPLWIVPEAYPTGQVRSAVRAYTSRAVTARKTPMIVVYGIPGRDCGQYSSSNPLTTAPQYRRWVAQVARGLTGRHAIVIVEPDALPLFSSPVATCPTKPSGWQAMLRFATKRLSATDAWVYLDAGHSNWTPYDSRAAELKRSGIAYARGFSTNVSNFRRTADEQRYAAVLLRGLRSLGVRGKHVVIDTSRSGAAPSGDGNDVLNPTWARLGRAPRLVFQGALDGYLWVKHPGESDGQVNGGGPSGRWCTMLADRLLTGTSSQSSCPQ